MQRLSFLYFKSIFLSIDIWKKELLIVFLLLFSSFVLRWQFVDKPSVTIGDESLFVSFTINTIIGKPFFEPHPPLSWMIFSVVTHKMTPDDIIKSPYGNNRDKDFGPFPYVKMRLVSVFFGSLIPIIIYLVSRIIGLSKKEAIIPAVLSIFESGLIIHSRMIMPDSIMIFFGLTGLVLCLYLSRIEDNKRQIFFICILSGIFLGLAVSVKWLALGFVAPSFFYLFFKKKYLEISVSFLFILLTYCLVLVFYFNSFYPGKVDLEASIYKQATGSSLIFPGENNWIENIKFIAPFTTASFVDHHSAAEIRFLKRGSSPYKWPFMITDNNHKPYIELGQNLKIFFKINYLSWSFALMSLLVIIIFVFKKINFNDDNLFLIKWLVFSYSINYVPFLFINYFSASPTWFFHYLPALIFSFMMIPFALRILVKDEKIKWWITLFIIFSTIGYYFYLMPTTYGF